MTYHGNQHCPKCHREMTYDSRTGSWWCNFCNRRYNPKSFMKKKEHRAKPVRFVEKKDIETFNSGDAIMDFDDFIRWMEKFGLVMDTEKKEVINGWRRKVGVYDDLQDGGVYIILDKPIYIPKRHIPRNRSADTKWRN